MKTNYFTMSILMVSLSAFTACMDYDELNRNPNKSTDMDPNLQIATVQMRPSENHQEWHRYLSYPAGFMNQWAGDWATIQYGGHASKYAAFTEQMWTAYYPFIIRDVVDVVQRTKNNPERVNVHSAARILRVENFLKLTDFYGDIPYFDAGMGYYNGQLKVKYDRQEDIYNDFFKELSEASAALTTGGDLLTHDLYFNGNIEKWKRFANSLHLRIAMRLIKVNPAKAREEAEKAIAAGVMQSNDDICYVKHENYQNPGSGEGPGNGLATRLSTPEDPTTSNFRITTELITAMAALKDPRIPYYARSYFTDGVRTDITDQVYAALGGDWTMMTVPAQMFTWDIWTPAISVIINGATVEVAHTWQRMQPSKMITAYDAPFIHFSYAETEFLLAEAAVRGWNVSGSAQSHFDKALEAAVRQWSLFGVQNFNDGAIAQFVAANQLTAGNELMQINTQLWILHFLDPMETWANWRRTGMPDILFYNRYPNENQSNGQAPRRLEYPLDEQMKNPENYKEAVDRMGGTDSWTNRVWWDKN
ncbi:MAG: SusD/RagB family nutrient-binding outer membrane lipoprotein [Dysgonamonadaceae bacterium]|nr:SusD/RagB family nutrient-binding outer membrane lipoprotein [Dysgonamonadaceae bacterium]